MAGDIGQQCRGTRIKIHIRANAHHSVLNSKDMQTFLHGLLINPKVTMTEKRNGLERRREVSVK